MNIEIRKVEDGSEEILVNSAEKGFVEQNSNGWTAKDMGGKIIADHLNSKDSAIDEVVLHRNVRI